MALALVLSFWTESGPTAPLQLRPQSNVLAGGAPLDPGSQSIPCVADWNGDGLPDLIVGYQPAWKVAVFTNAGTLTQPAFTTFNNLTAGGADIYLPASSCGSPAPWVCDYDHDGRRDLLVGHGGDGKVYFHRNTGTDDHPVLEAGVRLQCGGGDLSVGYRATPYVCDWDEDGLDDLLCGDGDGNVHFFKNAGTAQNPVCAEDVLLQAGGSTVNFGARSAVRGCDWDGDGRMDLIGSGSYYAGWCRNISSNSAPMLAVAVPLQAPTSAGSLASISTSYRMRIEVTDWNRDSVPDLLVGDSTGAVFLYEGYRFAFLDITPWTGGQFVLRWSSADHLRYQVLGGTGGSMTTTLAPSVSSGGKTTLWTNQSFGPVQFYRVGIVP